MQQYWCLSRRDYSQTDLKNIPISTSYIGGRMIEEFSTYFETNGTHVKCYSNEEWAQQWFELGFYWGAPCNTNITFVATIGWR